MEHVDQFTHDDNVYSLTKVRELTRSTKAFLLPIKDLVWILSYDHPDEDRVKKAKHRYPLLVTKDRRGRWTVIDGLHRLEKYRRKGIITIPVKLVTDEMLKKAFIKKLS